MSVRRRRAQFATIPTALLCSPAVSSDAKALYAMLDQYGDTDGQSFAGQEALSTALGVNTRRIRAAMTELRDGGWVVERRRGQGRTNYYWVNDRPDRVDVPDEPLDVPDSDVPDVQNSTLLDVPDSADPYIDKEPVDIEPVDKTFVAVGAEVEEVPASMIEAREIAGELADLVAVASGAKRKAPSRSSVDGIEKLIRIDEVPAAKVRRMLVWLHESGCEDAEFWKGNVLSGGKLREKWPTLAMKANASRTVGRSKVQRVQDTNQRLLYEANQRIAAEEREREGRMRELEERARSELGANEWGYLAGQGGL